MDKLSLSKCQPIEIDADNPFKNDALGREENITVLTQFITSFEQSIVLCIDGGWGQGKTTFIKMWQQYLQNRNITTIYFNAWESDYTDDALIALIGEISLSIKKLKRLDKSKVDEIFESIYKHGANLIKVCAPALSNLLVKTVSVGLTNADELAKTLGALSESLVKEQINKYEASHSTLKNFKEELSKLATICANGEEQKPLVIFIDELDRCRPNFAIEVLEKAKHLFNVDNIIFVLATDKTQLSHSIRAVYGQGLDVNGYLRRFIDFDYLLPLSSDAPYIIHLMNKFSLENYFQKKGPYRLPTRDFLVDTVHKYKLSLREQEAFFNIFNVVIRTESNAHLSHWTVLTIIFLIILKLKFPDLYKSLDNKNDTDFISNTLENIRSHCTPNNEDLNYYLELIEYVLLGILSSLLSRLILSQEIIEQYGNNFHFDKNKKNRLKTIRADYGNPHIGLSQLFDIKKSIEISNSFKFN
nr:P-loop NTPase fold protein [Snodgrassella alvi]